MGNLMPLLVTGNLLPLLVTGNLVPLLVMGNLVTGSLALHEHRRYRGRRFAGSWDKNGLEAEASWRALGIDHHNVFGPKHGFVMPKNDWKDFCSSISNGKPVQCSVCQELVERARVNKEALQDEDTERGVVEVAALADASGPGSTDEGLLQVRKGRRPKNAVPALHEDVFEFLKAVRTTTVYFILQHEAQAVHFAAQMKQQRHACAGLRLELSNASDRTNAHHYKSCFRTWALHDYPWHLKQTNVQCWVGEDDVVVVRSQRCVEAKMKQAAGKTACADMGLRTDVAKLASAVFLEQTAEISSQLERMAEVSWQASPPIDMKYLAEQRYPVLHDRLQELLVSIPHSQRNPAMLRFMGKVLDYVDLLVQAKSTSSSNNKELCKMSGTLDGDSVARTMITGILHKAEKVRQGSKRPNTSKLPGVDPSAIAEVGFALASCARQESLMKMFGLIAPKQTGVDIRHDHLPLFFAPGLTAEQANRDDMIAFDETTYTVQPPGVPTANRDGVCRRRASTRKEPFDIYMGPKRLASVTAQSVLQLTGSIWILNNAIFLAQVDAAQFADVPFFRDCSFVKSDCQIPCWRFGSIEYKGHTIFAHNDAATCRSASHVLLLRGLPAAAFQGTDNQSDAQAAWLLNPVLLDLDQWDCFGLAMHMYFAALCTGSWLASHCLDPMSLLRNCLCGYYMLPVDLKDAKAARFFHCITVANLLATLLATFGQSGAADSSLAPWRPSATAEDVCEQHFGRTKSNIVHRLPTVRAAILSAQQLHLRQARKLSKPDMAKLCKWEGLSGDDMTRAYAISSVSPEPSAMGPGLTSRGVLRGARDLDRSTPNCDRGLITPDGVARDRCGIRHCGGWSPAHRAHGHHHRPGSVSRVQRTVGSSRILRSADAAVCCAGGPDEPAARGGPTPRKA
ncbi:APC6 [Symbiodinium necroappetens]|uniref:APC6 protein n=1 Tax=Symbiodinium necroappetens TaxID=1628268 RepID=A0A812LJI6_9DINO|nr:APC6 [Symbiodinium necroappetens]